MVSLVSLGDAPPEREREGLYPETDVIVKYLEPRILARRCAWLLCRKFHHFERVANNDMEYSLFSFTLFRSVGKQLASQKCIYFFLSCLHFFTISENRSNIRILSAVHGRLDVMTSQYEKNSAHQQHYRQDTKPVI